MNFCLGLNLKQLEPLLETAKSLPQADLPRLLADIREVEVTALTRLSAPVLAPAEADTLLTVAQAAAKLNCSKVYLYKNDFPFKRKLGRKLLFSSRGIDEYLSGQG